jgi:putative FmdB family regulatory protein
MQMPTYDYRCKSCKARFELFLTYAEYDQKQHDQKKLACPKCGSDQVVRRIGRIRIAKSDDRRIEDMVDPTQLDGIEDDPKALGRLMRKMGEEMGEDTGPEFEEVVSRLEKGQDPEQIEKDMPELGEGLMDTGDFDD